MLTLDLARKLIDAAIEEAEKNGYKLAIAVVDSGGHLVASARMDGAGFVTPTVAFGKAWTASAWKGPSDAQGQKAKDLPAFMSAISAATSGSHTPQIGGLPVEVDGELVGAIGASGATGQQDEDVVRAALAAAL
jgi:uncharacterized protein GlcG (DUF336 family)